MITIQAKMKCDSVTPTNSGGEQIHLSAVTGDTEENKTFSKWTPSASVNIHITNPAAAGAFVPGKSYLVNFDEAPE